VGHVRILVVTEGERSTPPLRVVCLDECCCFFFRSEMKWNGREGI
jgi:hypothetical protein